MLLLIFLSAVTPALSEYYIPTDVKADVRFGEHNKRFDLSHIIKKEEKRNNDFIYEQHPDYDNDETQYTEFLSRRSNNKRNFKNKLKKKNTDAKKYINRSKPIERRQSRIKHINDLANDILANILTGHNYNRRFIAQEYAHHDRPATYNNRRYRYGKRSHYNNDKTHYTKFVSVKSKGRKKPKIVLKIQKNYKNKNNNQKKLLSDLALLLKQLGYNRRFIEEDFAYHENMNKDLDRVDIGNNAYDEFDNNNRRLELFVNKLHGDNKTRRVADPEGEILFHHAFPIDLKVKGYLKLPVN